MKPEGADSGNVLREMNASMGADVSARSSDATFFFREDFKKTYHAATGNVLRRLVSCCRAPGLHAIGIHRLGHWLQKRNLVLRVLFEPILWLLLHQIRSRWGIEIDRSAEIGPGFYIGHYGGITISGYAKIGKNVNISQLVTIGLSGEGDRWGAPTIGNDVYIAPGAKVFGKIRVGHNVRIGANAVVHKDIPDDAVVVLDPGFKIISFRGNRVIDSR